MKKIIDFDVLFTIIKIRFLCFNNKSKCCQKIKNLVKLANTPEKAKRACKIAYCIGIGKDIAIDKWDILSISAVNKATTSDEIREVCKFASPKAISIAKDKLYFLNSW